MAQRTRIFVLLLSMIASNFAFGEAGRLVIVGGGGTPTPVVCRMIELAGGPDAQVVVLPQASASENRGQEAAKMFRENGATDVSVLEFQQGKQTGQQLAEADLIWFPGGQQDSLMTALQMADIVETLRQLHQRGVVFGGTSAGAAVMSEIMITGSPETEALRSKNTPISQGLGLAKELIVDQHFVERKRLSRLLSVTMDHPDKLGIGISERTAIVVNKTSFEVMGDGSVVVIDARSGKTASVEPKQLQSARGLRLHVLQPGDRFEY